MQALPELLEPCLASGTTSQGYVLSQTFYFSSYRFVRINTVIRINKQRIHFEKATSQENLEANLGQKYAVEFWVPFSLQNLVNSNNMVSNFLQ